MAKMDLHKKTEVKEQLTEHLCAIIQQNELRKAHKLEELMQQLQLQATEEEPERQRQEEDEEEDEQKRKSRSCAEVQGDGREGNDAAQSREGAERSSKDSESAEDRGVKGEGGDDVQLENKVTIEPAETEQDCKTLENGVRSESVAS